VTKGGARARSGPAPDPSALRRERDGGEWVKLPAEGRAGEPPEWPLPTDPTPAERVVWAREWSRPQAVEWERNGQDVEVALYVRRLAETEAPGSSVAAGTLVKQMQEALGLSLPGLHRNRWTIEPAQRPQPEAVRRESSRSRLTVVDRGDGA
jgi:hypothetical protein